MRCCKNCYKNYNESKEDVNRRKSSGLDFISEGKVCDCCSRRYWGRKEGKLSTKKVGNIIATRDGTKKKSDLVHRKRPLQEKISLFVQKFQKVCFPYVKPGLYSHKLVCLRSANKCNVFLRTIFVEVAYRCIKDFKKY